MIYIATGCLGFLVIQFSDIVSLERLPRAKPFTWILGSGLLVYVLMMVCLQAERMSLPIWPAWLGWALLVISFLLLIHSPLINLPFHKTYIADSVAAKPIRSGLYALVRHPEVHWFILVLFSLILVSKSGLLLIATPMLILLDIVLVIAQDDIFFGRIFTGCDDYRQETQMLVPNLKSINAFINASNHQFRA